LGASIHFLNTEKCRFGGFYIESLSLSLSHTHTHTLTHSLTLSLSLMYVIYRLGAAINSAAGGNVGAMTGVLIVMYTVSKIVAQLLQSANDVVFRFRFRV